MRLHITTLLFGVAAIVATTLTAGCNVYDPNLGDVPYRCGTDEPRCPENYVCSVRSETEQWCVRKGKEPPAATDAGPVQPDADTFACNDDTLLGSNENINTATTIPIPSLADTYRLRNLAICPSSDVDVFRFAVDRTGKTISVEIELNATRGGLLLDILNSSGVSVRAGEAVGGDPSHIRAELFNAPMGTYHVQVKATPGVKNNYSISVSVTDA